MSETMTVLHSQSSSADRQAAMFARSVICACLIAALNARPQQQAQIISYTNENTGIDGYSFEFQTSDGISRSEKGVINNLGTDAEELVVTGSYTYTDNEGKQHTVSFVADKDGYHPTVVS